MMLMKRGWTWWKEIKILVNWKLWSVMVATRILLTGKKKFKIFFIKIFILIKKKKFIFYFKIYLQKGIYFRKKKKLQTIKLKKSEKKFA